MHISRAAYENFRNFTSLDLNFNQGFVVLTGPNGAGKTNFLEGLYFGGTLRRFPESALSQLFYGGQSFFQIQIEAENEERVTVEINYEQQEGNYSYKLKTDGRTAPRAKIAGLIPLVSFLPQDLNLLTHSPAGRRRFLDEALTGVSAEYRFARRQYEKTLKQRNGLWQRIKQGEARLAEMSIWDEKLADYGSQIIRARGEFLLYLNLGLGPALAQYAPNLAQATLLYQFSGGPTKAEFLERLRALAAREQEYGATLVGPHRDDFSTFLGVRPVVGYLSRGELRSVVLALKIVESDFLKDRLQQTPLLLLDDIFSEFDPEHQQKLVAFLKGLEQVFITTAHLEEVKDFLPPRARVYNVFDGHVQ